MRRAALLFGLHGARARWRRMLPYLLLLVVGVGVVAATTGLAGTADRAARATAERDRAGRVVDVQVDQATGSAQLTTATLARIRELPGVRQVLPSTSVALGVKTATIPGVLFTATTLTTSRPPMVVPRGPTRIPRVGEALLPAVAQGADLSSLTGRSVAFEGQRATGVGEGTGQPYRLRVVGLYDPRYQVDGRDIAYLSRRDAERLAAAARGVSVARFRTSIGFDSAQVVTTGPQAVPRVLASVQALGLGATTLSQRYEELPTVLELARLLGQVLGGLLLLVIVLAAASQTSLSIRSRWSEIGILRSVGFTRSDTVLAFSVEAIVATAAGAVIGAGFSVPLGILLVRLIGADTARQAHLHDASLPAARWVLLITAATIVAGCLSALVAARRAASLDPATVLRAL
ncbi:MAG: ABC transporter permease [Actinomycetota bacterium]|nr:ABC transporter permease [Actinomycetota bacterium]